jgi:deoxyadenosine/deoxycytidine kinase
MLTAASAPPPAVAVVSIEGNIGVGKSTLIAALQARLQDSAVADVAWDFLPERVDAWRGEDLPPAGAPRVNVLEAFYADQRRHAFVLQVLVLHTRVAELERALARAAASSRPTVVVMERSLLSERVFAEAGRAAGDLTDAEWATYLRLWEHAWGRFSPHFAGYVVLDAPLPELLRRIRARGREEEAGVGPAYLAQLAARHAEVFGPGGAGAPALWLLEGAADPDAVAAACRRWALTPPPTRPTAAR